MRPINHDETTQPSLAHSATLRRQTLRSKAMSVFLFLGMVLLASCANPSDSGIEDLDDTEERLWMPGEHQLMLSHAGLERHALVVVPSGYDGSTSMPLLLVCHGGGGTGPQFAGLRTELVSEANTEGVLLVFPTATTNVSGSTAWASSDDLTTAQFNPLPDDVGFLLTLLDRLESELAVSASYAAGFSSGGRIVHHFGAKHPDRLAGIFAVSTNVSWSLDGSTWFSTATPTGSLPIRMVHGRRDTTVPYDGNATQAGVQAAVDRWTHANECTGSPVVEDVNPDVRIETWSDCASGDEVVLFSVRQLGHAWPDAADAVGYDANRAVLDFVTGR